MKTNTIGGALTELAKEHPNRTAIVSESKSLTFDQLAKTTESIKELFGRSTSRRLAVYLAHPGGPDFTALQAGVMDSGHIAIPVPYKSTAAESLRYFSVLQPDVVCVNRISDARGIIEALPASTRIVVTRRDSNPADSHQTDLLADLLEGRSEPKWAGASDTTNLPGEITMIQFTSGSTGVPKGIALSATQLLASHAICHKHLEDFRREQVFIPVPEFHAMGNALVFEHLLAGCEVNIANGMMPGEHLLRMIAKQIHSIHANPTYFRVLLQTQSFSPTKLPYLRHFMLGSDWIDAALLRDLRGRFPTATIHCRYGLSEAYGALAYQSISPQEAVVEGSLGQFLPEVEGQLRPIDTTNPYLPSALWIRSPTMATLQLMAGGTTQRLTDEDGFLNTGDTAIARSDGQWTLAGRESQFIKVNGHRISPFEIEEVLRNVPEVTEATVTGIPDSVTGQRIVACLMPKPGAILTVDTLRRICAKQLSAYKIPHVFLLDFPAPKTPAGKVARAAFSKLVAERVRVPQ